MIGAECLLELLRKYDLLAEPNEDWLPSDEEALLEILQTVLEEWHPLVSQRANNCC